MARLSRAHHRFKIHEDTGIPTPELACRDPFDDAVDEQSLTESEIEEEHGVPTLDLAPHTQEHDADDERRVSGVTATSISSYPASVYDAYHDQAVESHQPYTPPIIRPSFRRPQSVQRMRMTSPFGSRSPRPSVLSYSRSRTGTPRSALSVDARGSPRRRRAVCEKEDEEREAEEKHHPLVLLHVTLLPINLPWSMESMQELVPVHVLENLQLLRSKVSDTVLQRGILIPHPREEYELLEERLLEALELKEARVTKCGHFRSRNSAGSEAAGSDSDSGLGSSLDGSDGEPCATCQHNIKTSKSGVGTGSRKWTVKVFASNGLMRSSAWAAAWSEMESVDVEILPWISDAMRKRLDVRREEEEAKERERLEDEEARIREVVGEQVWLAHEEKKRVDALEIHVQEGDVFARQAPAKVAAEADSAEQRASTVRSSSGTSKSELPQIYRPSQIPLTVLIKNYIFLLAQDRRNVAMFCLCLVALFFAVRPTTARKDAVVPSLDDICATCQPTSMLVATSPHDAVQAGGPDIVGVMSAITSTVQDSAMSTFALPGLDDMSEELSSSSGLDAPDGETHNEFERSEAPLSAMRTDEMFEINAD